MRIKEFLATTRQEDIQIQSSIEKLCFNFKTNGTWFYGDASAGQVYVRLRIISHTKGTVQVWDRMPIGVLFEREGNKFGHFIYSDFTGNTAVNSGYRFEYACAVTVGDGGSLELKDGEYLSLDLESDTAFDVQIDTLDSPDLVSSYVRVNPQSIQGITREINLLGMGELILPRLKVRDVLFQFEGRSVPVTSNELRFVQMGNNEALCVDYGPAFRAYVGSLDHVTLPVKRASSMTITPQTDSQFYVYTVTKNTL